MQSTSPSIIGLSSNFAEVIIKTHGRKKSVAKPAPPARDVETIKSLGLKIKILEFIGKVHLDYFIDWLSTTERVFDVWDIPDKLKVKLVAIKLRQHASLWWDHTKAKSKGFTSRFTPPTRTASPTTPKTASKATTPTTSAAEPEVDEPSDELVYPDRGEALVIQRVLNTQAEGSNLFMEKNGFEELMKTSPYVFTLVVVEDNEIISTRLCIPLCSLREAIILDGHACGLVGHFGHDKTLALLCEQFYWPKMEGDVNRLLERCHTCHIAKTYSSNAGLYTPLSVPVAPWKDVSLDFVLEVGRFSEEGADQSKQIKELHRSVQEQIIQHNKQYKEHADKCQKHVLYREGDLFWIHLQKERFSAGRFGKMKPFVSYKGYSDDELDSWSSIFQEGEDDAVAVNERVNITNMIGAYFAATNLYVGLG
nr:reverse transcriptase domain-containing protein [Tanacetum cinerariifolium]